MLFSNHQSFIREFSSQLVAAHVTTNALHHGSYVRTVGKTGVTSAIVDQSMFTIKHPPKDMTLQCNGVWQDSGTFPAKTRQIVLCSHAQFGWRLDTKRLTKGILYFYFVQT